MQERNRKKLLKRRGRKKISFVKKRYTDIKELASNFMNSESTGAYIGRALLGVIAIGGIFALAAITPNIFSAFGKMSNRRSYSEKQIRRAFYYLRNKKLIKILKSKDGISKVKITKAGKKKLMEFAADALEIKRPAEWDGKWRAVIFDIPEKWRVGRESLRAKLRELGFYQLQRSVFIHPFPVEDEILFISSLYGVERYLEVLTVDGMLDQKPLKNFFNLS